jgi:pyruvate decarboxylase
VQYGTYNDVSFHTLLPALAKALKRKDNVAGTPKGQGLKADVPVGPSDKVVKYVPLLAPSSTLLVAC